MLSLAPETDLPGELPRLERRQETRHPFLEMLESLAGFTLISLSFYLCELNLFQPAFPGVRIQRVGDVDSFEDRRKQFLRVGLYLRE